MVLVLVKNCLGVATGFSLCARRYQAIGISVRSLTIFTSKGGISTDFLALLGSPLTEDTVKFWYENRKRKQFYDNQKFLKERHDVLGPDLATAQFVVERGGAVKFWDVDRWFRLEGRYRHQLPNTMVEGIYLEAVDASGTQLAYPAMENFIDLKYLRYLNISNCPYVDDWFLAKCYQLRDSLEILDVSGCPSISESGLACLHHLMNLRTLNVSHLPQIEYKDITFLLLEEMLPNCDIVGVGFLPRGPDMDYYRRVIGSWDRSLNRPDNESPSGSNIKLLNRSEILGSGSEKKSLTGVKCQTESENNSLTDLTQLQTEDKSPTGSENAVVSNVTDQLELDNVSLPNRINLKLNIANTLIENIGGVIATDKKDHTKKTPT